VTTGKKWQKSIPRFRSLQDKIKDAIQERIQSDYKLTKMLIKCSQRIVKEGSSGHPPSDELEIIKLMHLNYAEIVAFYKDTNNQASLVLAANEY